MLAFWKARLVLLAVPKTGTTALEAAFLPHADAAILNPPQLKHMTVRRYHAQLARVFEQNGTRPMELMAVLREPVDWLSSWYRYRGRPALAGRPQSTADIDFKRFVEAWLEEEPPEFARVGRQSRFVTGNDGVPAVDHLFRHDRIDEAVHFLEHRLSVSVQIERHNVSPEGRITPLPSATKERLRREAAADFELWRALCTQRPDAAQ